MLYPLLSFFPFYFPRGFPEFSNRLSNYRPSFIEREFLLRFSAAEEVFTLIAPQKLPADEAYHSDPVL